MPLTYACGAGCGGWVTAAGTLCDRCRRAAEAAETGTRPTPAPEPEG